MNLDFRKRGEPRTQRRLGITIPSSVVVGVVVIVASTVIGASVVVASAVITTIVVAPTISVASLRVLARENSGRNLGNKREYCKKCEGCEELHTGKRLDAQRASPKPRE